MTRKSFLKRLSTLPILSALWPRLTGSVEGASPSPSPASRVRPSDPGWPDQTAWDKLNQTVSGRLIKVESPLAGYAAADAKTREKLLKDLQNPFAITMVFQDLARSEVETLWNPFFDQIKKSSDEYTIAFDPIILAVPAQKFWDTAFLKKNLPQAVFPDSREGAPDKHYWWAADNGQIGKYWYGYQSVWLPETLLAKTKPRS